jgi:hypothetical protein
MHIDVPVFEGQNALVEAKYWKKIRWASAAAAVFVLALLGAYVWYYFAGSRPAVLYSIRFPASEEGQFAKLMDNDQSLLRRGGQISRYDLRADKAIWSVALVDREEVARRAGEALAEQNAQLAKWKVRRAQLKASGQLDEDGPETAEKPRSEAEELRDISRSVERTLASQVHLRVEDHSVWVIGPSKAIQYDWDSGKPAKGVTVPPGLVRVLSGSDKSALLVCARKDGGELLTRLDLISGEFRTEQVGGPADAGKDIEPVKVAVRKGAPSAVSAVTTKKGTQVQPGQLGIPLNTKAKLVTSKSFVASGSAMDSMDEQGDPGEAFPGGDSSERLDIARSGSSLIFAGENVAQLNIKLLQKNFVQYKAFKDKPKVSELDKGVNAANAVAAMSEVMNEIRAEQTGGMRAEDESRYLVRIKRLLAGGVPEWSGEVIGPPAFFSLKTVDVLTAGKAMYVFDKTNKKLWESKLAYPVGPEMLIDSSWMEEAEASRSPCVEREQTLYFFDQGVLTAFDLASGNVRWRLTTVGISAIHFDDKGTMYVSTSSAGAEALKYTKQVDLSRRVVPVIMKVDPRNGKILWKVQKTGSDIYLSGKYLYTLESVPAGGMRIYRLNPGNGEPVWEHYEKRATSHCDFRRNTIQLLYDDQLQLLRFWSL